MNILPKKRWHVRTKDNIARVRRDEAKAAEDDKIKQNRIKLAEREARRELLLQRSRKVTSKNEFILLSEETDCPKAGTSGHINFFKELEDGVAELKQSNKEHDKEQKEEREKYEKQIGYLTYLGQDTNEALGKKSWYDVAPERSECAITEVNLKSKIREDPLQIIKKYTSEEAVPDEVKQNSKIVFYKSILNKIDLTSRKRKDSNSSSSLHIKEKYKTSKNKRKRHKSHKAKEKHYSSSESNEAEGETNELRRKKLEILRLDRLKREKEERRRTEELLAKITGGKKEAPRERRVETSFKPKYNSQFNPEFAKQNYNTNR